MSRKKLFIENIFAYGFINILNMIVPFLFLPLITRLLTDPSDFGVYSLYTTIIGFGTPFAILGLYDAMFREYFEKDDEKYKYDVTTTTQRIILFSSIVIVLILILLSTKLSTLFLGSSEYYLVFILAAIGIFIGANNSPIQAPTRMQNQRKVYILSGLISSVAMYGISIILLYLGYSYFGLIYASIFSSLIILFFFWIRNKKHFLKGKFNKKLSKKLLKIGLPLLPTFLIYWIYNSMDKIMIANILGQFELGIYSIGSKFAQISQIFYGAFAGGYSYFKFSTMKDLDQVRMNSYLFEYLGVISFVCFIFLYPFIPIIFSLIFDGFYIEGYIVAPYLFLSPLLLMLFQVIGSQFIIINKSYLTSLTLLIGAISNIILNYFLIRFIGIEGAAISTMVGYFVSLGFVTIIAKSKKLLVIDNKIIFVLLITILYLIFNRIYFQNNTFISLISSFIAIMIIILLYSKSINLVIFNFKKYKEKQ
jgi:O-antigen/teichoic acid export membrane protein